jgi:hypothetical protein
MHYVLYLGLVLGKDIQIGQAFFTLRGKKKQTNQSN